MQLNSLIKFGGLAFDVASDDKVRQLAGMMHQGARRRGLIGSTATAPLAKPTASVPSHWPKTSTPIPFQPSKTNNSSSSHPYVAGQPSGKPSSSTAGGWNVEKWVTMDSAKKVFGWAGTINQFLNK